MDSLTKKFDKAFALVICFVVFLLPLFFLPFTSEFYVFNKNFLLLLGVCVLLLMWSAKIVFTWQLNLKKTPYDLPLLGLLLAFLVATFFGSINRTEAFFQPETTGTILLLVLFFFIVTHNLADSYRRWPLFALITSGAVLSLIAIYQFVGLGQSISPVAWMKPKTWTPVGSPLFLLIFLVTLLPLVLINFAQYLNQKSTDFKQVLGLGLGSALLILGTFITFYQILPGKEAALTLMPYQTAWSIAIESFKQKPLFGVGPENYISAFNRFRPSDYNSFSFWNTRFGSSSSYPLQLLTVTGLLGLIAFVWLLLKTLVQLKQIAQPLYAGILLSLILLVVLPGNLLTLFTLITLLSLWAVKDGTSSTLRFPAKDKVPGFVVPLLLFASIAPFLAFVIASGIFYGKIYTAEYYFKKSLDAYTQNNGNAVYTYQTKATTLEPQIVSYHLAFSQSCFALANALAGKPDLSEQDKANVAQLIEQSIREAKNASSLNPLDSNNWENLAQLYRNIINFAQGADQWALAAYQQTITTDPINPRLRVNLGGLFYAFGNYEMAARHFQDAINLKGDYANAYYNLAATYREQKRYPEAYQAMQLTLNYVPIDSADYQKARQDLTDIAKFLPSPTPTPPATTTVKPEDKLSQPEPIPSPTTTPIVLPQESGFEVTPIPTETVTPTP